MIGITNFKNMVLEIYGMINVKVLNELDNDQCFIPYLICLHVYLLFLVETYIKKYRNRYRYRGRYNNRTNEQSKMTELYQINYIKLYSCVFGM